MTCILRLLHRLYERTFRINSEQGYEPFDGDRVAVWAIDEESLMEMLRRVEAGEEPDHVLAETYANAEVTCP